MSRDRMKPAQIMLVSFMNPEFQSRTFDFAFYEQRDGFAKLASRLASDRVEFLATPIELSNREPDDFQSVNTPAK